MTERDAESRRDASHAGQRPAPSRRQVLRIAAPAVLTMVSAPVTAGQCFTASAAVSLHPSGLARHSQSSSFACSGNPPVALGARPGWDTITEWPSPLVREGAEASRFNALFSPTLTNGTPEGPTLLQVLQGEFPLLAKACVATLLNIRANLVSQDILGMRSVQHVWSEGISNEFRPYAGATPWAQAQVYAWLARTWGEVVPGFFSDWS